MIIKVSSSNPEIKHKLEFLFDVQLEDEMKRVFINKGIYAIEHDRDGGVLGLTLKTNIDLCDEWETIDTETMTPNQCLNRIAMIHLMAFFSSPVDFSNFIIIVGVELKCVCGAEKVNTTHSTWCDKYM